VIAIVSYAITVRQVEESLLRGFSVSCEKELPLELRECSRSLMKFALESRKLVSFCLEFSQTVIAIAVVEPRTTISAARNVDAVPNVRCGPTLPV
jgi:hypothetical protein